MLSSIRPRSPVKAWLGFPVVAMACTPGSSDIEGVQDLEAALNPVVDLVVELSWTSEVEGYSWVEYGSSLDRTQTTAVSQDASIDHHASLYGLPAYTEVHYRAVTVIDGVEYTQDGEITTGGLPPGMPNFIASSLIPEQISDAPYLLTALPGAESYLAVIDRLGRVVWYYERDNGWQDHSVMSVAFEADSNEILCGAFTRDEDNQSSEAITLDLQGGITEVIDIGAAHHSVARLPDGGIATLQPDQRTWYDPDQGKDMQVIGDAIVEYDPDGDTHLIFSTWDWGEPVVHDRFYKPKSGEGDWSHANALKYDPDSDTYLLSLGNLDTVLQIGAWNGEVVREFGEDGYAVEEGTPFIFQHDPSWTQDGTLLMSSALGDGHVFAVEYEVDDMDEALREVWSYGKQATFMSVAGGEATRLSNGNTLFNVGYQGVVLEVSPDSEPVWDLGASMGSAFYGTFLFDDFY